MAADIPACFAGSKATASGGGTTNIVTVGSAFDGSPAAFPVIAGETIIVAGGAGTHLPTGINDSASNGGYAQAAGTATSPASWIWASPNVTHPLHAAGTGFSADTVTVTWAGTGDGKQSVVMSVPGLAASPADSGSAATASGSSTSPSVTSGALAQARELIVAVCCSAQATGEARWPAPWQVIAKQVQTGITSYASVAVLRNYTGTSAVTVSPSLPGTPGNWTMSICGFKAAANPLKSYVGATVSAASFADSPTSWGAALEWDTDMGRAPCGQRTRVFYMKSTDPWGTTAGNDPLGMVGLCNSHPSMRPVAALKPNRMGVITPATATSEIASMCAYVTMVRNNGVPEVRWSLWNEPQNGGGHSSFGDGTSKNDDQPTNPWRAGGPVPPPAGGWTGQQAGSHYQAYCNLYGPSLLLSGYLVGYKPLSPSYQAVVYFFPGAAWRTGAQGNNAGGCNEIILDIYAWDTHQDVNNKWLALPDQLARGALTSYGGVDYSFSPEMAFGLGEIGVTDGPNTPDDSNQQPGWTARWMTNVSAAAFSGHPLPVPGVTQFFLNRITNGRPSAPIIWFSEKPAPAGNAIDSQGRINSRTDAGDAWRALYDALSVDAATTGSPPVITTTSPLPAGQAGVPYSFLLQATGGTAPLTWAVTTGGLPAGLSLNTATGQITGTPATAQTLSIGFTVTDSASLTGSATLSLTIAPGTLSVPPQSLPGGTQGTAYSTMLSAAGGTPPYTWAITAGALPAGLSLAASTGIISGVPAGTGTTSFTVQVTDHAAATASRALSVTVTAAVFTIVTSSLPGGQAGVAYTGEVDTSGGVLPVVSWTVTAGALPPGLSLAIAAPTDPNLDDEAAGNITDEAGGLITQEA